MFNHHRQLRHGNITLDTIPQSQTKLLPWNPLPSLFREQVEQLSPPSLKVKLENGRFFSLVEYSSHECVYILQFKIILSIHSTVFNKRLKIIESNNPEYMNGKIN